MDLLTRILGGRDPQELAKNSRIGKAFRKGGVTDSPELRRVLALPRRTLDLESPEAAEVTELVSSAYRAPGGTMTLLPIQALALVELHDHGGILGPIPVGYGKTLISLLAGAVVEARRPLLIIPAKLVHKTNHEMAQMQRHWRFPIPEILSYEKLSLVQYKRFLFEYRPDLIVCDECHRLKDSRGPRARRLRQYLSAAQGFDFVPDDEDEGEAPEAPARPPGPCRFVALSGTLTSRSLKDYAHLSAWALGEGSPLPRKWPVLREWADALDEKVQPGARLAPGALIQMVPPEEAQAYALDPLTTTRRAFSGRLLETPGVIGARTNSVACALNISGTVIELKPETDELFERLRKAWETPSGIPFSFAPQLWAYARQLASGFYYEWDPPGPLEWMDARKAWASFCREVAGKRFGGQSWDTEKDIANGVDDGYIPDPFGTLEAWREIRDTFKPNSVPVWVDDAALNYAANWGEANRGVVWVEHGAFGAELARRTGWRYFKNGGVDAQGPIEATTPDKEHTIIASIKSNGEGRNMQAWAASLITSPPTTNMEFEQLLGRLHRQGQTADEVNFEVMLGCFESWSAIQQARRDAEYQNATQRTPQKLLLSTLDIPDDGEVYSLSVTRKAWAK